ncbi:hypothetical protein L873DRAFT_1703435 [Choiromyces venosus 120613-1]|uniref:GRAM domain-containing protein n=1 Tax=Choiromyces venosus 120613-1 TaxID=1336337 RepID=A0A3N4J9F4_9PEZI|nr:hypothetical protein L873DRAFT_1703435 [Choiromyces venosus 120613-1]
MSTDPSPPVASLIDGARVAVSEPLPNEVDPADAAPTESHALAVADHDEKGAAQIGHGEPEVKDLGWNERVERVPQPLVGGLPNEELWTLVRRFNKQMYHVKATPFDPPGGLDLNIADEDEFSPDKLRSNVERLYMTVIVGMASFGKHIARLRSWNEFRRTGAFCVTYYLAWFMNFLMPALFIMVITLIVYPPSRTYLFPPAPLALVDAKSGGLKKPIAGVLGSHSSLTGAPEKHHGEAVEQEAHNFVSSFGAIAMSTAAGKHPENPEQEEKSSAEKTVPDPTDIAMGAADAKKSANGKAVAPTHDKTKKPVEIAMWEKARPIMHVLGDIADGWERFSNALSPTSPFPKHKPRLKIAGLVAPMLLTSLFVDAYMFTKASSFITGIVFFGDPIISRIVPWLNREFPGWQKLLELRNTVLKGVPSNAQLTITLLRIGEASKAPLPPPPRSGSPVPNDPANITMDDVPPEVSPTDVTAAAAPDAQMLKQHEPEHEEEHKKPIGKRLLGFLKGTTKTGVSTALGVDKLKATAGSEHAKNRLGVLQEKSEVDPAGPVELEGRYRGKKGYIYIITSAASPCVCFTTERYSGKGQLGKLDFSIAIADIIELKNMGGLGWKSKMVVGWAMDREIVNGLEIVEKNGQSKMLTAIPLREELFNRLVAMGGQKWESW